MPEVISDASPSQYLYQLDLLNVLPTLYGGVTLSDAVVNELAQGRARGVALPDPASLPWVTVRRVRERTLLPLVANLGSGEREVLALAADTPGALVLLDDAIAKRHARLLGRTFTGTLGVLLMAKGSGHVSTVRPVLDRPDVLRFRLDPDTRAVVLRLAGEGS